MVISSVSFVDHPFCHLPRIAALHIRTCKTADGPILKLVTLRENRVSANNKNYVSSKVI